MAGHIIVAGGTALTAAEIVALTAGVGLGASAVADATGAYPIENQVYDAKSALQTAQFAANTAAHEVAQGLVVLASGIPLFTPAPTAREIWRDIGGFKGLVEGAVAIGKKWAAQGEQPVGVSNRGVPEPIEQLPEQIPENVQE